MMIITMLKIILVSNDNHYDVDYESWCQMIFIMILIMISNDNYHEEGDDDNFFCSVDI